MPKALVLGNGNILVGFDKFGEVNDFYFPYVGLENQIGAHNVHKIGIWVDNKLSWLDDGSWEVKMDYGFETLASKIEAFNHNLKVKLEFRDVVYNESDIFIREVTAYNLEERSRIIKLFFYQRFEIYESRRGDTAYFDPLDNTIIHYKGRRNFLINTVSDIEGFDDFGIGNYNIEGKEGSFRDAEDGVLSKNPIEHGLVDSVIGFSCNLQKNLSQKVYYWVAAGKLLKEVKDLNKYILKKTPTHLIKTTEDFWQAWLHKTPLDFRGISDDIVKLFKKSLLIMRTHVDNRGGILASGDTDLLRYGKDYYSYVWTRDAAIVATALDLADNTNITKTFFEFCNEVITEEGYFMHKYLTDRSLGSSWHPWIRDGKPELPIQEDETALVIIALKKHFEVSKDLEFIENIYNSLIKKATQFMISYRDEKTNLPKPSYDLWEEKFGTHTFTCASVYGALNAAAEFAELLGKDDEAKYYRQIAFQIKEAILKYLYDESSGYFYKAVNFKDDQIEIDSVCDMSSAYGIFKFNVLDINDAKLDKAIQYSQEKLIVKTDIGGIVRYENDYYFRVSQDLAGNPWFITTLWLAQYQIAKSDRLEDLDKANKWLDWVVKHALNSGIMSEQLNPFSGEQISAAPLIWSHSEFVSTVIQYIEKLKELK